MKVPSTSLLLFISLSVPTRAEDGLPAVTIRAWWEIFDHPGLTAVIEQGLAAHPDLVTALAEVRAAEAGVALAQSRRRPEASLDAGIRWGREQTVDTGGVEDDIDPFFGRGRMSWELDLFGKGKAGLTAAAARAAGAEADWASARLLLALEIARAYIDVALLTEEAKWRRRDVEDLRLLHARSERRTKAGLSAQPDFERTRADWQQAAHGLTAAETQRDQIITRLQQLTGGSVVTNLPDDVAAFTLPSCPDVLDGDVTLGRPDVVRAYATWRAADGEVSRSQRDRLPALSLVLFAAGKGDDAGDPERWSAWAGPVVSLPIWSPERKAVSERARSSEQAAESAWQEISLRAVEEIDRAWAERTRSDMMINHMFQRRRALESAKRSAARKREAGLIQEDEWRQARLQAAQAARAELRWRAAGLHAHLGLIAALGG